MFFVDTGFLVFEGYWTWFTEDFGVRFFRDRTSVSQDVDLSVSQDRDLGSFKDLSCFSGKLDISAQFSIGWDLYGFSVVTEGFS
jgi:hypothetical protein